MIYFFFIREYRKKEGPSLRAEVKVLGVVQGVGFRPFVYRIAVKHGLIGYVRNRGDACVEIVVEGEEADVKGFLKDLEEKKPSLATIDKVFVVYANEKHEFDRFVISKSSNAIELLGTTVPPDIAICDECLNELRDSNNRRHGYFFITCTNCGPRFTIVKRLPYDRPNTTMAEFNMCNSCLNEYEDPTDRRFHAQTVACRECGPKAYLTYRDGKVIDVKRPIQEAGKLLEDGFIVAIKGYGGFHIATATTKSNPIARLRKTKHRAQKPFAIMAKDLNAVSTFAKVSPKEAELLTSYAKPIVLLRKNESYYLSDLIAPELHNIGVMLPYTGLHVMLFDYVKEPAFVMTSANEPGRPIVKDNDEALKRLNDIVDYFLLHDRMIAHRCDDSVVRVNDDRVCFIRRSRGYVPKPIRLKESVKRCSLGLGAELNVTSCALLEDKAFFSQHVGDVEEVEALEFLKEATKRLIELTNCRAEAVACDLHPRFVTTKLAYEMSDRLKLPIVQVQHHHAHVTTLMAEQWLDEMVAIVCDGYGYGLNGQAWGGEVLYCDKEGFRRLGHLQEQPMVGGDLATYYPLRMAAGMLHKVIDVSEWLFSLSERFPHRRMEVEAILASLKRGPKLKTTSCGRVLDAVAATLGICYERTYEGEPAMKLEAVAVEGSDVLRLKPMIKGNVIETTNMLYEVFHRRQELRTADLACSAQSYLARGLAELAVHEAERLGVKIVGLSGGVAHNEHIVRSIKRAIEDNGLTFVVHELTPPGDGGISLGQAFVASFSR